MKHMNPANPEFERLMAQATKLTRAGHVVEATAAIQAALGHGPAAATHDDTCVIDVEAREVDDNTAAPAHANAHQAAAEVAPQTIC